MNERRTYRLLKWLVIVLTLAGPAFGLSEPKERTGLLTTRPRQTTLHSAAGTGDIGTIAALMDHGVTVDRIDVEGRTALHTAVKAGQVPTVEWLLAHDADANCPDDRGVSPLSIALRIAQDFCFSSDPNKVARFNELKSKQRPIMVLLISHGGVPSFSYGIPQETVLAHPQRMADLLIKGGVNLEPHRDSKATVLHRAAWWGKTEVVADLLKLGANVNAVDYMGATPLHAATRRGSTRYWDVVSGPHMDVLELLIAHGAPVNATNNTGATALHGAASYGDPNAVALLIEHNADINACTNANRTPLHEAAKRGSIEVMTLLIAEGADPNIADSEGNTPLLLLLGSQQIRDNEKIRMKDYVITLIKQGVRGDVQNDQGVTPLQHAAALGFPDLLEELLTRGAPINVQSTTGWTALHSAVAMAHTECMDLLIEHGAQVNSPGQPPHTINLRERFWSARTRTPLQSAASRGDDGIIQSLITSGADINAVGSELKTPLSLAFERHHLSTIKLLLDNGADPNTRAPNGIALVYRAAAKQRREMVDAMLQHGAHTDAETIQALLETGTTPLHEAAKRGDLDLVNELLANGREFNIPDKRGSYPIHHAQAQHHLEIVKRLLPKTPAPVVTNLLFKEAWSSSDETITLLMAHSADVNARDLLLGDSLLHRFAWQANHEMIAVLLARGADVNAVDMHGETPLAKAVKGKRRETVALLLSHGSDANIATTGRPHVSGPAPLHLALSQGTLDIAEMLVRAGANINARTGPKNLTPLHMALGHRALFELMLAHGGQINCRSRIGRTPLHMAAESGQTDVALYLIEKGASINALDNGRETPLHRAAKKGHGAMCKLLLSHKADITVRNMWGRLALDYAIASELEETIPLLRPDTH